MIDGGHHKQWILDQVLRALLGGEYAGWVETYDDAPTEDGCVYEDWDTGCAP